MSGSTIDEIGQYLIAGGLILAIIGWVKLDNLRKDAPVHQTRRFRLVIATGLAPLGLALGLYGIAEIVSGVSHLFGGTWRLFSGDAQLAAFGGHFASPPGSSVSAILRTGVGVVALTLLGWAIKSALSKFGYDLPSVSARTRLVFRFALGAVAIGALIWVIILLTFQAWLALLIMIAMSIAFGLILTAGVFGVRRAVGKPASGLLQIAILPAVLSLPASYLFTANTAASMGIGHDISFSVTSHESYCDWACPSDSSDRISRNRATGSSSNYFVDGSYEFDGQHIEISDKEWPTDTADRDNRPIDGSTVELSSGPLWNYSLNLRSEFGNRWTWYSFAVFGLTAIFAGFIIWRFSPDRERSPAEQADTSDEENRS